jgi:hypothetical protein
MSPIYSHIKLVFFQVNDKLHGHTHANTKNQASLV